MASRPGPWLFCARRRPCGGCSSPGHGGALARPRCSTRQTPHSHLNPFYALASTAPSLPPHYTIKMPLTFNHHHRRLQQGQLQKEEEGAGDQPQEGMAPPAAPWAQVPIVQHHSQSWGFQPGKAGFPTAAGPVPVCRPTEGAATVLWQDQGGGAQPRVGQGGCGRENLGRLRLLLRGRQLGQGRGSLSGTSTSTSTTDSPLRSSRLQRGARRRRRGQ